jgi:hypothetical protein
MKRIIAAFFSILMPGIGQIYNGQFVKGIAFLLIEHFDNILGNINTAIHLDFNGQHKEALHIANFEYVLFYPGFFVFFVWDAWYFAKPGADKSKSPIPFLLGGILGLFSVIYSSHIPMPTMTTGLMMIIPMLIGMIIFRKQ